MATTQGNQYFDLYPMALYNRASFFNSLFNCKLTNLVGGTFQQGDIVTNQMGVTGLVVNFNSLDQSVDIKLTGQTFSANDLISTTQTRPGSSSATVYASITSISAYNPIAQSVSVEVRDLLVRFDLTSTVQTTATNFYPYLWTDSDRVDTFSYKYYGDPSYYWITMLSGDKSDFLYDFPLNQYQFNLYLVYKYSALVMATNNLTQNAWNALSFSAQLQYVNTYLTTQVYSYYAYYSDNPELVFYCDATQYAFFTGTGSGTYTAEVQAALSQNPPVLLPSVVAGTISYYQYEQYLNEQKRAVSLLDNDYTSKIVSEFKLKMGSVVSAINAIGDI